ncbi:MAG: hypothetical protein HYZ84_00105 [Candidatus Omnitrophica bacterium]|nr:hypothetical protein [Candidatus Omnitrophota bacterium]
MRTLLLTSTFLRHEFVIREAAEKTELVGVWQESKTFDPFKNILKENNDEKIIRHHFEVRNRSEEKYFRSESKISKNVMRRVDPGGINLSEEIETMKALKPDVVLVFGSGLLKVPLIESFKGRIINMHLGLSPYYRGSGTNFWPLVNREPEFVGATIHYIDPGIDTGPILAHARPIIAIGDGPHDIGNKAIQAGCEVLIRAAQKHHEEGPMRGVAQWQKGRFYQIKDFKAEAVRRLYQNFETGMIEEYLHHKAERDSRLKLIELEGTKINE